MNSPTKILSESYAIKQLPIPIAYINTQFEIISYSRVWADYFEFDQQEIKGKNILNLFDQYDNSYWQECLKRCFQGQPEYGLQSKKTSSQEKWFEWSNVPWYDENENVIGAIIQVEDITSRIQNEIKFERLERLLKDQSEISKIGTWEFNLIDGELTWSEMTKKIHGVAKNYSPSIKKALEFYKKGYSRDTIVSIVHNGITKGLPWCEKLQIITKDGEEKWIIAAGKALYKNGKLTRLIGTIQDIDDQVNLETKIRENEQLLQALIDNLPLNVYIKDVKSRKILVNKSECDYLGIENPEEILGKSDFDFYDKEVAETFRNQDLEVINNKKSLKNFEAKAIKKDGQSTYFLASKIPFFDTKGKIRGVIGMSMDISKQKEKEKQLKSLTDVSEVQNKKLLNFAHIVSHNLRSYTSNFSMLLDLLQREEDEEQKNRILDMLGNASDNLHDTVENLNEVVDVKTNTNLAKRSMSLRDEISKTTQNLAAHIQKNNVAVTVDVNDSFNVLAVPAYLESILLNLITNAIKYKHPDRTAKISISSKKENDYSVFSVQDNGLGIDLERYREKLFGLYKTFHGSKDARGLGLYITKNQIEAMGGSISVSSEKDKGTTFTVHLSDKI